MTPSARAAAARTVRIRIGGLGPERPNHLRSAEVSHEVDCGGSDPMVRIGEGDDRRGKRLAKAQRTQRPERQRPQRRLAIAGRNLEELVASDPCAQPAGPP